MKRILLLIPAFALAAAGCKKDEPATPVTPTPQSHNYTIREQLQAYEPTVQTFTIDAAAGGTITGSKGGKYTFLANSFVNPAGQQVTGNVTIELKEVYSPLDMVMTGVFPMSQYGPLYSGGEYHIDVKQGNTPLHLANGVTFGARIPSSNPQQGMMVFDAIEANDTVTWVPADSSYTNAFTNTQLGEYDLQCDSIHWGNCDQFAITGTWTNNQLSLSAPTTLTDVKVYVYYNGHNSIFNVWGSGMTYSNYECWINLPVTYIAVGTDAAGNLYSCFLPVTVAANGAYTMTMTSTTATAFAASMNALN